MGKGRGGENGEEEGQRKVHYGWDRESEGESMLEAGQIGKESHLWLCKWCQKVLSLS